MRADVSFNQDALLMADEVTRLNGRDPAGVNSFVCLELNGAISLPCLEEALAAAVRRHSGLRTSFGPSGDIRPIERKTRLSVFANRGLTFPGLYIRSNVQDGAAWMLPPVNDHWPLDRDMQSLLLSDIVRPFDYSSPPLLRARLFRVDPNKHILVLVAPRIICDFWSLHVLHEDVARYYGNSSLIASIDSSRPSGFDEFVRLQYERARTDFFEHDVAYWLEQRRRGEAAQVSLRDLSSGGSAASDSRGGALRLRLSADVRGQIRAFACSRGVGLDSVVLGVFCAGIGRITGKQSVAVNIDFRNRPTAVEKEDVGWFSNSHQIVVDAPSGARVEDLAAAADNALRNGESHQGVPPPLFYNRIGHVPARGDANISFVCASGAGLPPVVNGHGLDIRPVPLSDLEVPYPSAGLTLFLLEEDDNILLIIRFPQDRVAGSAMSDLLAGIGDSLCSLGMLPGEAR